ncbi:MAG: hypothetical protein E6J90_48605 [Deltaproteobacteria bacterium]|nr:MAG: hypothetical protein E6J90_48605 [Deltaproteobacteria bacterium]TMQ10370.1 MAG: hypothetical protein E6J91_26695 [Deltaproteobacteria bacterium]
MAEARARFGADAPETDAQLLEGLGGIAHEELHEDSVAATLLRRAHEQDRVNPSILADLAETYFAAGQTQEFTRAVGQIDLRRASLDVRVGLAALTWASGRLTRTVTASDADRLLRAYREAATDGRIRWTWNGTRHALTYGCHRREDVEAIIAVLTLLEQPVTEATRRQLAKLLAAPAGQRQKK